MNFNFSLCMATQENKLIVFDILCPHILNIAWTIEQLNLIFFWTGAQKFMGVQKLLRGHDVSASLRHLQMAPEPNYFKTAGKYRPTVPRSVARPIPLHCMRNVRHEIQSSNQSWTRRSCLRCIEWLFALHWRLYRPSVLWQICRACIVGCTMYRSVSTTEVMPFDCRER